MFNSNEKVKAYLYLDGKWGAVGDFKYRLEKSGYSTPTNYVGNISINGEYSDIFTDNKECYAIKFDTSIETIKNDILSDLKMSINKWISIDGVVYATINLDILKNI